MNIYRYKDMCMNEHLGGYDYWHGGGTVWDAKSGKWVPIKKPKKGDVVKIGTKNTSDYEIVGDEKWKPSNFKFITKKMIEQDDMSEWFGVDDLTTLTDIQKDVTDLEKKDYNELNDLKLFLNKKKIDRLKEIEMTFFFFFRKYPKKDIFFLKRDELFIYNDKPELERLSYKKEIIMDNDEKEDVVYWIFKDSIIFKS